MSSFLTRKGVGRLNLPGLAFSSNASAIVRGMRTSAVASSGFGRQGGTKGGAKGKGRVRSGTGGGGMTQPSRTKLVKSLKPRSPTSSPPYSPSSRFPANGSSKNKYGNKESSRFSPKHGRLEVAPKRPAFVRDEVPHAGLNLSTQERGERGERRPWKREEEEPPTREYGAKFGSHRRDRDREGRDKGRDWGGKSVRSDSRREFSAPRDTHRWSRGGKQSTTPTSTGTGGARHKPSVYYHANEFDNGAGNITSTSAASTGTASVVADVKSEFRFDSEDHDHDQHLDLEPEQGQQKRGYETFSSPPLMPGLLDSIREVLGRRARPTAIQSLAMKYLVDNPRGSPSPSPGALLSDDAASSPSSSTSSSLLPETTLSTASSTSPPTSDDEFKGGMEEKNWKQYLLASETGSGKSIAYLLPVLQDLKHTELHTPPSPGASSPSSPLSTVTPQRAMNPRALILAPTHELSRQLSTFAKSLLHNIKLKVVCASRANVSNTTDNSAGGSGESMRNVSAAKMADEGFTTREGDAEFVIADRRPVVSRPVDVLVGTPTKLLELVRGRGWDWEKKMKERAADQDKGDHQERGKRTSLMMGGDSAIGRKWTVGEPEIGLANVEWVVVDEADVLFDPDFQESTRMLLADIASARGHPVSFQPELNLSSVPASLPSPTTVTTAATSTPPSYPFHLILTTATIPSSLASYLDTYHPSMTRLASPRLHKLPSNLKTEWASWSGGRKNKDVEKRIRLVWWQEGVGAGVGSQSGATTTGKKSKIIVFCNKSSKVLELGKYLEEQGISNVALTSTSETRQRGNNKHLDGFLRLPFTPTSTPSSSFSSSSSSDDPSTHPHVLITTSLLSRGLDFSPEIKHVFILDSPRNMVDFLHRAGRSGRAGEKGKVVVFGKEKGRGAGKDREIKGKVRQVAG